MRLVVATGRKNPALSNTVVDLFAGCGGLGLGLEQAGFTTVFVNELHDDARNTYLLNRMDNDWLQQPANQSSDIRSLTVWPEPAQGVGSLHEQWKDVRPQPSKLLLDHVERIEATWGGVALVAGGPPCQGFSGIGHRRTFGLDKGEIPGNYLFRDMVTVVSAFRPKAFIFENVRGLLSAKWTPGGTKGEIWEDVQAAFRDIRVTVDGQERFYNIGFKLVRAKDYGVPQNRPRVIMVGLRSDLDAPEHQPESSADQTRGLIPTSGRFDRPPHPHELWGDLAHPKWEVGGESREYNGVPPESTHDLVKELRRGKDSDDYLPNDRLTEQQYSKHSQRVLERFAELRKIAREGGELPERLRTKKFAQRVVPERWRPSGPMITATSLPDDYVHYEFDRAPTVREWARLQTFPDWYEFAGKRTTGGRRRAGDPSKGDWSREVPKFTQIGNAVPVELGRALGEHLKKSIS